MNVAKATAEERHALATCAARLKLSAVDKMLHDVIRSEACDAQSLDALVKARELVRESTQRSFPRLTLTPPDSPEPSRPRILRSQSREQLESVFSAWETYVPQLDDRFIEQRPV